MNLNKVIRVLLRVKPKVMVSTFKGFDDDVKDKVLSEMQRRLGVLQ